MNSYTIVTNDEYELPVKCDIRVKEAAEFLGTTTANIRNMVLKPRKKSKYKVLVSGKVTFDKGTYQKRYDMTHDRSEYFKKRYKKRCCEMTNWLNNKNIEMNDSVNDVKKMTKKGD